MPTTRRKRDELVDIDQAALRALLEERHLKVAALARMTGYSEQTLAHILKPGARCQKSRRAKIAKALQVPQELLSGEEFPVPLGLMPDGFEFRYSPRTKLAASRFIARVDAAFRRDLRTHPTRRSAAPGAPAYFVEEAVIAAFCEFMMIGEWRKRFIEVPRAEQEERGFTEPATLKPWEGDIRVRGIGEKGQLFWETTSPRRQTDPAHETAILNVIRAMEHVLEPWLEGRARLNYRAVRDFVHLPRHPFAAIEESIPATSPLAILPVSQNSKVQRATRTAK